MDFSTLNPAQRRAVEAPDVPLLIVAGAGTGKTRTLTHRIAHLIERGAAPASICAITFTNKAAKEMRERVERLLPPRALRTPPFLGTFHSLGAHILRAEARHLGRTARFSIFDDQDSVSAVKKIVKAGSFGRETPANAMRFITFIKSGAYGPSSEAFRAGTLAARTIFARYETLLKECNAFDFDDLIEKAVWLFRRDAAVRGKYARRFAHLFVDEYQDVSPAQYELVKLLAGTHRRVSVVGDDAQMIYGWRYANLGIFLDFEKEWPGAEVVLLEENYRSTSTIVEAASALAAANIRARKKNLWTKRDAGDRIAILEAAGEDEEAGAVAEQVAVARAERNKEGGPPSVAVLYRTNAQSRALEQALIERGIRYRIYGGIKFYERREIRDAVAALRLAANPKDSASADRLMGNLPKKMARELIAELPAWGERKPVDVIEHFLARTNYFDYLERNFVNADERRENLAELVRFAGNFRALPEFLEGVALLQATDDVGDDIQNPAVHLSTIHLAKGLEFDRVFLVGCAEGLLPHARSMDSQDEIEEERRLMYVAMTRARDVLAISFSGLPSRFLGELPKQFIDYRSLEDADGGWDGEETTIQLEE